LNLVGGIIQGMSGSPIIQDGQLAGCITHVFVSDPTRGYGVLAEWMVEESRNMLPSQGLGVETPGWLHKNVTFWVFLRLEGLS